MQGRQDEEHRPLTEVFVGSAADDRVIGNGGRDIFSNFAAADTFLGGATKTGDITGIVQIKQSNYVHAKGNGDYLRIEQITAADLKEAIGPQMAGYEAVVDTTPGLRLIDNVVNPLTGEQRVNTGFAQVGRIQLIGDAGLIADTMDVKAIVTGKDEDGKDLTAMGLQLSNQAHRLLAGMGDDVILGGSNTDVIVGNGGEDWIGGGAGNDILAAGSGDVASSGSNPDNAFGNVGSTYVSTIVGGTGNDTLVAIEGDVIATGGEGADTFAFYGAQAGLQTHLTITDFEIGIDRIDVSQLGISAGDLTDYLDAYLLANAASNESVQFDLSELTSNGEDSIIVTLAGVTVGDLVEVDKGITDVDALKEALSEAISTSFVTTSVASDWWLSDLAPLTYPSAI